MAIHFVADLHFNGDNARHALPHGFADTAERTRRICEVWRARIAPDDTVWILGNVGNPVHLAELPGTKHLVRAAGDPQPWNCLATRRYASVCDMKRLETPQGVFLLVNNPAQAPEIDATVLHGQGIGDWTKPGFMPVSACLTGWGPVSLEDLTRPAQSLRMNRAA